VTKNADLSVAKGEDIGISYAEVYLHG